MNFDVIRTEIRKVFELYPDKYNHLEKYPWLVGCLGKPESQVWFWAENPSLKQAEKAKNPDGGEPTEEAQWNVSKGDKLFRSNLYRVGLKEGSTDSIGGWNCYITNIIKECDYVSNWRKKADSNYTSFVDEWIQVILQEMKYGRPKLSVIMGRKVEKGIYYLQSKGIDFGEIITIPHYSYLAFRPEKNLGPMHPQRIKKYQIKFDEIIRIADSL